MTDRRTLFQTFVDEMTDAVAKQLIAQGKAHLAVYTNGKIIPVPDSGLVIGRCADADINTADDNYTSGHHARLYRDGQQAIIEDLGSTNGTWLNQKRVWDKAPLSLHDVIRVGSTSFAVTFDMDDKS